MDGGALAKTLSLDILIPVLGIKRCKSSEGFEFVYPAAWLADQTLYRRQVQASEDRNFIDLPDAAAMERMRRRKNAFEPLVAFGPMAGTGEDNMSVIVAPSPGLVYAPVLLSSELHKMFFWIL